jgi:hypothetical protein
MVSVHLPHNYQQISSLKCVKLKLSSFFYEREAVFQDHLLSDNELPICIVT